MGLWDYRYTHSSSGSWTIQSLPNAFFRPSPLTWATAAEAVEEPAAVALVTALEVPPSRNS